MPAVQVPNASSNVFISYASQDGAIADVVVAALERHGGACWIAPRDVTPGGFYADAIVRALNEARILVLVLTENTVTSPHVLREVERTSAKRHATVSLPKRPRQTRRCACAYAFEKFVLERSSP
jgi:hypothetical protein